MTFTTADPLHVDIRLKEVDMTDPLDIDEATPEDEEEGEAVPVEGDPTEQDVEDEPDTKDGEIPPDAL